LQPGKDGFYLADPKAQDEVFESFIAVFFFLFNAAELFLKNIFLFFD
jgi:hypothetical protein